MSDFLVLKVLDKFKRVFTKLKIDYPTMRLILQTKLAMDERKVPTLFNQDARKDNTDKTYGFFKKYAIYILIGLVLIPFLILGENYNFQMTIAYSIIIFMIMTSMISDFSSVLLDVRDRSILSTKPITARTVNASKFMHIFIYLMYLTLALTGIPLIVSLFKMGIVFFLILFVELILVNILVLVLTSILYMFILRVFDGEKLKDMINYVQIGLTLVLLVGYQVAIRSFTFVDLDVVVDYSWWSIFIIPMWFAAPFELILNGNFSEITIIFSLLCVVVPIVALFIYVKMIPTFERNLKKLLSTSKSKKKRRNRVKEFMLALLCRTSDERTFFRFTALMMKEERDFKLKVYPSVGFAMLMPVIMVLSLGATSIDETDYSTSFMYLSVYICALLIPNTILMLGYSNQYKATWIYKVVPVNGFSDFQRGSIKAFIVKLYLPVFLLLSVFFCAIFGLRLVPELLAVFVGSCLFSVICFKSYGSKLPFSEPHVQQGSDQAWKIIILMLLLAILAFAHYTLVAYMSFGAYIYLALVVVANYIVWKWAFPRNKG